ncbi:MAG: type IIA DNA topoisomerase subunit B [Candidatus Pacebacteria bacterium]|nr:type IIA DNA topoisomerase subunit B [Candidatus Paceibacterota bacterium]
MAERKAKETTEKKTATPKGAKTAGKYGAEEITVLEGLEAVRRRPGMYIGTTGPEGLHHLVWEVFDNSRDEAMGGFADRIEVALLPEGRVRVADNGRGIPVDIHSKTKVSALETIMTTLHAGGKFGGEGYKVSGGLHGVGVSVVNALSRYVKAVVHRDGGMYMQEYTKGGKAKAKVKKVRASKLTGTVITFEADPEIFTEIAYDWNKIVSHLRQQAYLVKGLSIAILDLREYTGGVEDEAGLYLRDLGLECPSMSFYFEGGLLSLVKFQNRHQKSVHKNIFYVEKEADDVGVEISLQYVDDISARISAFANNIYNPEHGTHITGFKTALTRTLNNYSKKAGGKEGEAFTGDDVLEGITVVVSVKMPEIQFEGQTKGKLGSVEARGAVESVFSEAFSTFLEEHPEDAKMIIGKATLALKARKAAKAAKDSVLRKGALEGLTLPGKLADCSTRNADESELFIVEGDSAGGSSKQGRDRRTQAILPLRGKILNVERARLDRMLASNEIKSLVVALGTAIGDTFDIEKLRYHKIIIATDADVDGAHIRTLLLTLFYRYFKPIIEGGYLYIAQPPLYKIKKGREVSYAYTEDDKIKILGKDAEVIEETPEGATDVEEDAEEAETGEAKAKSSKKVHIQRYKGLGEMNPEELWETTMDPEHRVLKQVTIEDVQEADRIFDTLMGTDVASRKTFIQSNAKYAQLDI